MRVKTLTERRGLSAAVAALLFATILGLRFLAPASGDAVSFLYVIPVVLLAVTFGERGGQVGGLVAFGLSIVWILSSGLEVSVLGYCVRLFVFLLVGDLTGRFATGTRALEAELERHAQEDPLTGLFNRRRFEQELERQLAYTRRHGSGGALLLIDLDRFKQVNDELGHTAGDTALCAVAETLRENLRGTDTAGRELGARLGGDEFVALLPEADAEGARVVAERLIAALAARELSFDGTRIELSVSVGVALYDETGCPPAADLLTAADRAMYVAKAGGGSAVALR